MNVNVIIFASICVFPLYGMTYGCVFVGRQFGKEYWHYLFMFYAYAALILATMFMFRASAFHFAAVLLGAVMTNALLTSAAYKRFAHLRQCSREIINKHRKRGASTGIAIAFLLVALVKLALEGLVPWDQSNIIAAAVLAFILGTVGEGVGVRFCKPAL